MNRAARILVVEDEALAAKDIQATLSVMDYDVVDILRQGEQAVEVAKDVDPDVVLMDILLAGEMDGIEAAQRIQGELGIPIVFLTAHAEPQTVQRAKQFGPYGYISKPVDPVELRTAIEVALHKHEIDAELERSRIEIVSFARTVAQDLRDPLGTIRDHLDDLEDQEAETLTDEAAESLGLARQETNRAIEMVRGLLAYAEAGGIEQPEPTDADQALSKALDNLTEFLDLTDAEVTSDPLPTVLVPREQLALVFQHLVENAIEHGSPEGIRVHVGAEREDGTAVLRIEDNGPGIAPGVRENIFQLFHRGDSQHGGAAGVGLAVCKRIVEACDGGIWVESTPGEGSTFFLRLPLAEQEGQPSQGPG